MNRFGFGNYHAEKCAEWIKDWFRKNSNFGKAIVGISGGIDSSVVATLCVKALGENRVIGVLLPDHEQDDIKYAETLVHTLRIKSFAINIGNSVDGILDGMEKEPTLNISSQTITNLPARIRMAALYAVSQSSNGRVVNTCNLSEDYIGYSTRYGDSVGDLSPLAPFTKSEVIDIGYALGLSDYLMDKEPSDGLCGKTDEENLGFTYETLDRYIRTGICEDGAVKNKIDALHQKNKFKMRLMDVYTF